MCSILAGAIAMIALGIPTASQATPYFWETGCYNALEKCWATDLEPNSGYLGNQSRIDDLNILPTLNGSTGLWYGGASANPSTDSPLPPTGGDYPWGGGDSVSEQQCKEHPYPEGVACNWSPSQYVTQNYTDESGGWHFAMGGGSQCESNGQEVPCNFGHRFYPYDCNGQYSANCVFTTPMDDPFDWDFPETMYFQMTSNLYVGGAAGPWHAFLCADISDPNTGAWLEVCDEPWNSTGAYEWTHMSCGPAGSNFAQLWQPAGTTSSYMNTSGESDTNRIGSWIHESWTMSRPQFFNLISKAHEECGLPTDEYRADNYKLYYSENGIEEIGSAGYGAGVDWEMTEETMSTNY